jgi:hypothetical protein
MKMFSPGKYFIGDLCYVMHDKWDRFCEATISDRNCLDGEFDIDGIKLASYGTKYGDGVYEDGDGYSYGVDAGLIGCIRVEDIAESELDNLKLGHVHEFKQAFRTGVTKDGTIWFGDIEIVTGDIDEEDNYEYEDQD